jgi:hypothetical protein
LQPAGETRRGKIPGYRRPESRCSLTSTTMENQPKTSSVQITLAWILVVAPLLWGVSQTLIKAMALFR